MRNYFCDTQRWTIKLDKFYVDDLLKSVPDVASARTLTREVSQLCGRGGFNLTKFMSNRPEALSEVPKDKVTAELTQRKLI